MPQASVLSATLINMGLVSFTGMVSTLVLLPFLPLLLGDEPGQRWHALSWMRARRDGASERFASWMLAYSFSLLALFVLAYHIAHVAVTRFHHPGLIALFIAFTFVGTTVVLGMAAHRGRFVLEGWLARKFSSERRRQISLASPFAAPLVVVIAFLVSSKQGGGVLGFLGLLKREELELGFLVWAGIPPVAAALYYLLSIRRYVKITTLVSGILAGMGLAAFLVTAIQHSAFDPESAAFQERLSWGGRILAAARSWSDGDDDGVAALFGGGDCDDENPDRRPGALDIPGNGVDEDCSGKDDLPAPKGVAPDAPAVDRAGATLQAGKGLSLVLLTVDALRADIGYAGYPRPITPNIDALSKRAVVFEKAYALSSYTGRSLAPMFIGRYPSETFCNFSHFTQYMKKNDMLAETLQGAGFATRGIGSHFYFEKPRGLKHGFDDFYVEIPPGPAHVDQKSTSDRVAERAIQILGDPSFTKGRFFLWAHFMDPHRDYLTHEGFSTFGSKPRDLYDGEVAFADHHLGRVLEALKAQDLEGRTVVMVTSDHGEAFGEHGIRFHGKKLWEEIVRVPWLMAIPGVAPARVPARVSHIDLPATVYDVLGVVPPPQNHGHSLFPFTTGKETQDRRIFIDQPLGEYMEEVYAIIDGDYKLIHTVQGNRFELFNLDVDPGETADLAGKEPDKLQEMQEIYRQFRQGLEINAPRR